MWRGALKGRNSNYKHWEGDWSAYGPQHCDECMHELMLRHTERYKKWRQTLSDARQATQWPGESIGSEEDETIVAQQVNAGKPKGREVVVVEESLNEQGRWVVMAREE